MKPQEYLKEYQRQRINDLSDSYISSNLLMLPKNKTKKYFQLIEAKRIQIQIQREIKQIQL